MKNLGIRQRVLLIALAPMTIMAVVLVAYFTLLRYGDVEDALDQRGATMARQQAPASVYGMFSGNVNELGRLARAVMKERDVSAVAFYDRSGTLLSAAGERRSNFDPLTLPDGWQGRSPDGKTLFFHVKVVQTGFDLEDPFYAGDDGRPARPLELGSITIELSRSRVAARKVEILVVTLLSMAVALLATSLVAKRLGRDITEPVVAVEDAVRRIREGKLTTRVSPHPASTLKALEEGINEMAVALEAARNRSAAALASSEAELRKQYDFASALLQAQSDAGVGMMILLDGRAVYANEAVLSIHGYGLDEFTALPDTLLLLPPEERPRHMAARQQLMESNWAGERRVLPVLTKDGETRYVDMVMMPLKGDMRSPRMVVIEIDVSQRIRDQARIEAANAELQVQKDEAERANMAKSRFLAAASHDLRQPLHALALFSAELEGRATTSTQRRLSRQINTAVGSLSELLSALLDISRLDISELQPQRQAVALQPLLDAAALNHQRSADAKQLSLSVHRTSLWVDTDPHYLARIVSNLIGNAVRYTRSGRVLVGVRHHQGHMARIEVWDTGIGISEEHLPSLFQEFYQVHNPERDANKGLGLGLSIVDRLTRALGHTITVRSWPGRGTVFSVVLPIASSAQGEASQEAVGSELTPHLLLVANTGDDGDAGRLLQGWGYGVSQVSNAAALGQALKDSKPGVVICDESLCCKLFDQLRESGLTHLPVLVMGAMEEEDAGTDVYVAGNLSKPLKPARLRALLRHLLEE
jgi:PAS domain S-box-containing protein